MEFTNRVLSEEELLDIKRRPTLGLRHDSNYKIEGIHVRTILSDLGISFETTYTTYKTNVFYAVGCYNVPDKLPEYIELIEKTEILDKGNRSLKLTLENIGTTGRRFVKSLYSGYSSIGLLMLENGVVYSIGDTIYEKEINRMIVNYRKENEDQDDIIAKMLVKDLLKFYGEDYEEEYEYYSYAMDELLKGVKNKLKKGEMIKANNLVLVYILDKDILGHFIEYEYLWHSKEAMGLSIYKDSKYNKEVYLGDPIISSFI